MKRIFTLLFVIIFLTGCNKGDAYQPEGLRKLSETELIERVKAGKPFPESILVKDSLGNIIPKEDLHKIDHNKFYETYYVNEDNEVVEIVIKEDKDHAQALKQKLTDALEEPIAVIDINCSKISAILENVYETDQKNRQGGSVQNPDIDKKNQQIVVSIIEGCCFPTVKEHGYKSVQAVFLVMQHAGKTLREKYFPLIKKSAEQGDLSWSTVALMEDRMLMDRGEKQKYGSQVRKYYGSNEWTLYPIQDPENVNDRRANIGLEPIEDYLRRFGIEYKADE